ncbi:MAG: plasmid replication protein RepC [Roseiarcus sp.]
MQSRQPTTPFGRRSLTLAHVAAQMAASARQPDKVVHKWRIFRAICTARPALCVSERSLAVLNALLSFHPETTLAAEDDLIVFPSNEQLCLRTHGMPPSTLRRQLAALVDAGLIVRRDSPNGKRYARKGRAGEITLAFGFDLSPLAARAEEFERMAEEIEAEARAVRLAKERITLCRRDIAKMIATGVEEDVPTRRAGQGPASWQEIHAAFRGLVEGISRNASLDALEVVAEALSSLANDVLNLLENHLKVTIISANEARDERHKQNSKPNSLIEFEPCLQKGRAAREEPNLPSPIATERTYPLGMVLSACPDIVDYAKGGIANWRDFLATAAVVRPMLGISPSAWEEARMVMGEAEASVVVACLLQRSSTIQSAGGYLRELTRKAGEGEFSLGPVLMAQINAKNRERRSA